MSAVRSLFFLVVLGAWALPAGALATTYCVADAACVSAGGTNENGLVQHALDDAQAHPGLDRVQIGSGAFTGTGFLYSDASAGNGVQIVGAGRSLTSLSTTIASSNVLTVQGSASTVQDLALALPAHDDNTGLALTGGSAATRVDVTANAAATNMTGIDLYAGGTLSDIRVTLPFAQVGRAIVQRAGAATVSDAILDASRGLDVTATAPSAYRRIKIVNAFSGLSARCGTIAFEDSVIRLKSAFLAIQAIPDPAPACPGPSVTVNARHITIDGDGQNAPQGIKANASAGGTATVTLRNSILTNVTTAINRQATGGAVNVGLDYVDFNPANDIDTNSSGGTGAITVTHQVNVTPGFVSATDEHLVAGSPLIDAGDPAGLAAGESALDLGGGARILDGTAHSDCAARQDFGAYEYDPGALQIAAAGGPAQTTAGADTAFSGSACSPDPGATLTFAWDFGDGSTGTGPSTSHTFASAGDRTMVLTITDSGGRQAVRNLPVTVAAAPAPPADGTLPPPAGGGSPPGPTPAVAHCVVPRLRGVTVKVAKRRLLAAHCLLGKRVRLHRAHRTGAWVVRSAAPKAGTVRSAGAKVRLMLIRRRPR